MKEIICFDLDGTLLNSDRAHIEAFKKAFKKNNLDLSKVEKIKPLFGIVREKIVKKLFPKLSFRKIKEVVEDQDYFVVNETNKYSKVIRGVKKALKKLKERYKLVVISNCSQKEILALLKGSKLEKDLFSLLIGNDEVKRPKPAPDEIFKAEHLLKREAKYIVGDTTYDIIAGKKARVKTIAVLTGTHKKNQLQRVKPDLILKSVSELPKVI